MAPLRKIRIALFGRRAGKSAAARDESAWAPGEMAECVHEGTWFNALGDTFDGFTKGHVAIVHSVRLSCDISGQPRLYLGFARWPEMIFDARGFRKLTPRADAAEAADANFVDQLKGRTLPSTPAPSIAARLKRILS